MTPRTPRQWTLGALNAAERNAFADALGDIFEHSPWVAEAVAAERPFASVASLHRAMTRAVDTASPDRQMDLIRAHPDLAGRLAQRGQLTAASETEQRSAGLDALADDDRRTLEELNRAYRERFEFPFIICAKRNDLGSILAAMRKRLDNDRDTEIAEALTQIGLIAELRLCDRIAE